ncbi:receptor-like protein kinase FERONIA [Salvia divinorum]|uniref:Receptor-like protein kinase FERONIA n=1 Tax=Salvia divinorum TaxID=28513 RepID=A0ABD1HJ02_SALDI
MISHPLYLFFLISIHSTLRTTTASTVAAYNATELILLSCGASAITNDTSLRRWDRDQGSKYVPSNAPFISSSSDASTMEPSVFPVPYGTARVFHSPFTYTFPLSEGQKFLRLYFYPNVYSDVDTRLSLFSVNANAFTLCTNFSAFLHSKNLTRPSFMMEFVVNIGETQKLDLTFTPNPNSSAFVNGIEIVSIPHKLYLSEEGVEIKFVDRLFDLNSGTALENLYRLNVGGGAVEIGEDSGPTRGMFRGWIPDDDFIFYGDYGWTRHDEGVVINYTNRTSAYTAPPNVYISARTMTNISISLEWGFPVDSGFYYLLRLHFCGFRQGKENDITLHNLSSWCWKSWKARPAALSAGSFAASNPELVIDSPPASLVWNLPAAAKKKRNGAVVGSVVGVVVVVAALAFLIFRRQRKVKDTAGTFVIGGGGFGRVYRGVIRNAPVAIKRLNSTSRQGAREFLTEIDVLFKLRHLHLVSLVGYCGDGGEMILVYDYMAHGSLRGHLYNSDNSPLTWKQRLQICLGAAKGLDYLHSSGAVIHRDVKSSNILLDEKWVAKVSDFGLSKMAKSTHVSTVVKGSLGYVDPEYYRRKQLTLKSDVYSFGVVLLEVLCARPPIIATLPREQVNLAEWATFCYGKGTVDQIVDSNLKGQIASECLSSFAEIAVACLVEKGIDRPSMNDVVRKLESAMQLQANGGSQPLLGISASNTTDEETFEIEEQRILD